MTDDSTHPPSEGDVEQQERVAPPENDMEQQESVASSDGDIRQQEYAPPSLFDGEPLSLDGPSSSAVAATPEPAPAHDAQPGAAGATGAAGVTGAAGGADLGRIQGDSGYLSLGDVFADTGVASAAMPGAAGATPAPEVAAGAAAGAAFVPPKWGKASSGSFANAQNFAAGGGAHETSGPSGVPHGSHGPGGSYGPGGLPPTSGGAWVWQTKLPWRKRHPVLFWGGVLLLLLLVFSLGRATMSEGPLTGPKIAVVTIDGMILDAKEHVVFMEKMRKDPQCAGAVIRINSPGGGVGPSQELYAAVKRLAEAKPVVASFGSMAASGGYYAALGAREIISGPSSITASIGVKMQIPNFEGLMRTIGVSETTLTTGRLKDAGSSWRQMTQAEQAYFTALLNDMYDEFLSTVAKERKMPPGKVKALADGRAMTGRQALESGLVDSLGDFHTALERVKTLCGMQMDDEVRLVEGPEKKDKFLADMVGSLLNALMERQPVLEQSFYYN